jgi:tRNA (mo5U34)-methyltransferase
MDSKSITLDQWLIARIKEEPYWFHRMELPGGLITPGWSDPKIDKLPYFGLPEKMTGMRVLDIGHAEGFFSFEAERRGASEVIGIENYPPMARKFEICRAALGSHARSHLASVYDLNPKTFGTFDLVMFFGVLYHLRHPLLALEKIHSVCAGTLLVQTTTCGIEVDRPLAEFHPLGVQSGPAEHPLHDPTCFWFPNTDCCIAMLQHVGFKNVEEEVPHSSTVGRVRSMLASVRFKNKAKSAVFRAQADAQRKGQRPDEGTAPWS